MQITNPHVGVPPTIVREWNSSWVKMPHTIILTKTLKPQEILFILQNKLISIEDISWEIRYTLNLGQLLKLILNFKKYLCKKLKLKKP